MNARTRQRSSRTSRPLRLEHLEPRYLLTEFDVLVFSKTAGFRHDSIESGIAAIEALGEANDFSVTATEDANEFNANNLANYEAVVFLNTTGDVLNSTQEAVFENYIQNGGGWVGIHAAADTEYDWNWYGELLGAHFQSHPSIQQATVVVADGTHPSTAHLPERWERTDEWYNYQGNPRGDVHVLATLDEDTYFGGSDRHDHPIAWYHDHDGGRAWYTGLGHTSASYTEPEFLDHLLGGIHYAAGRIPSDGGAAVEDNYRLVELYGDSINPMSLTVAEDGRVFFVERGNNDNPGRVKRYDPQSGNTTTIAELNVFHGGEDGLLGIALDPNFNDNHWIYLFYSPAGSESKQHLSRFTLVDNQLDLDSEQILLEIPTQRISTNHSSGSLAFGPEGNLFISTGDNTDPFQSNGYAPNDERPGRAPWDAQKSSSNTNDLRGKILRITPTDSGGYEIPEGNLFPADGAAGRPEIYIMGNRNPFRISIDAETGWLYWGDVGPDAGTDDANRGPRGYDEINQARDAGNYGWPYVIADNKPYRDYNFATGVSGPAFDPAAPVNDSPNNTGATVLPPAEPAMIWYPYGRSSEFPEFGNFSGRTSMAGPIYHFDPDLQSSHKLPAYFDDTLFIYDWSRRTFHEVKLDADGEILKINPFLPDMLAGLRAIDMEMGPDGSLYILEWNGGFGDAPNSRLYRLEYLGSPQINSADFNQDGNTDGFDFLQWQRGHGIPGGATRADGDANQDGSVDRADLEVWRTNYSQIVSPLAVSTRSVEYSSNALDTVAALTGGIQAGNLASSRGGDSLSRSNGFAPLERSPFALQEAEKDTGRLPAEALQAEAATLDAAFEELDELTLSSSSKHWQQRWSPLKSRL